MLINRWAPLSSRNCLSRCATTKVRPSTSRTLIKSAGRVQTRVIISSHVDIPEDMPAEAALAVRPTPSSDKVVPKTKLRKLASSDAQLQGVALLRSPPVIASATSASTAFSALQTKVGQLLEDLHLQRGESSEPWFSTRVANAEHWKELAVLSTSSRVRLTLAQLSLLINRAARLGIDTQFKDQDGYQKVNWDAFGVSIVQRLASIHMDQLQAEDNHSLITLLDRLAALGFHSDDGVQNVLQSIRLKQCSGQELGRALSSCARLFHSVRRSWMLAFCACARAQLGQTPVTALVDVFWGLSQYRWKSLEDPALVSDLMQAIHAGRARLQVGHVARVVQGIGHYQLTTDRAFVDDILAAVEDRLGLQGNAEQAVPLLLALAKMSFTPREEWTRRWLRVARRVLPALTSQQIAQLLLAMSLLGLKAEDSWCDVALTRFMEDNMTSENIPLLLLALPTVLTNPRPWVRRNAVSLERVTSFMARLLRLASPRQLAYVVVGCARLRFYPGRRFMSWHEAACVAHGKAFPIQELFDVFKAYRVLQVEPQYKLYLLFKWCRRHVLKRKERWKEVHGEGGWDAGNDEGKRGRAMVQVGRSGAVRRR